MNVIKYCIDRLLQEKEQIIIAIDGSCGAGKTTLANRLAEQYDCNVLHMDDFFLRPEQRTAERFAEIGGNVDYERFYEEVLNPLKKRADFYYRPYDCKTCSLREPSAVRVKRLNIIEGTYSMHPYFENPYDLKIFVHISSELQKVRIMQRSSELHIRFFKEWIPMENRYFESNSVCSACDFVFDADTKMWLKSQFL